MQMVLSRQGRKGFEAVHFSIVLKDPDSLRHWRLITYNSTCLGKMPLMLEAIAAEVTLSHTIIKRFTAGRAEWFLDETDILQTCLAERSIPAPLHSSTTGKAALREKNISEGRPEFCSENLSHFIQGY
jgi:hypothetical protein